jgi:hypothetical protein
MGLMRFLVHHRDRIPNEGIERIYICGQDELPWYSRAFASGNQIVIERSESDSGCVCVPWRIEGHGEYVVSTATLMERPRPYQLEVELARGSVNLLRNQMAVWEMFGLEVPDELRKHVLEATRFFSRAATHQASASEAADWAEQSLSASFAATDELASTYARQALEIRRTHSPRLSTLLGARLGEGMPSAAVARQLAETFTLAALPMAWRTIQSDENSRSWEAADAQLAWAASCGLKVTVGPLLQMDDRGIPDWTYLWEGDFESLLTFMLDHVRAVVERYRGKVNVWQVASRISRGQTLALSEEERLQITAQAISLVRQLDPRAPVVVTFDQPWAEYLAKERLDLAPLHFADALVRAGLGLSALGLEINVDCLGPSAIHRNPLAYSRLIDEWSLLELPLMLFLTIPHASQEASPETPDEATAGGDEKSPRVESQREWLERRFPLFLAKSSVQAIVWNQLSDAAGPHESPQGGLFDSKSRPKPALRALRKLREEYLQ